ncbi:cell division transport system permease protein [Dysgonomonas sp. PFB1-18]|nr:cell division transport system permease protein [Dysgonomonas sp. PF1-14]MDH6337399.1 cell division transport system permease protein [Dysgonomonas sp. PF1-16]MDH6379323.1 cell division transport system permease protein [Dysgonomonas sp. PFB1-18]MDH6396039.1 cell division transport system permease protein [Dysgonomonas sp. PF1-23]
MLSHVFILFLCSEFGCIVSKREYLLNCHLRKMSDKRQQKPISLFTSGVITTISITLVLFLLGLTILLGFTGRGLASYFKENIGISIELSGDISDSLIAHTKTKIEAIPYVKSTTYITKEEVKKQLLEDLGGDPEEVLGYDPSRSYIDVFIKSEYMNSDSLKKVEASLKDFKLTKGLSFKEEDIEQANTNISKIGTVLLILAVMLILISFTLIRNTIQLNIYSKRFLINTMQLVGATNGFIRRPFVLSAIVSGILAAIFANVLITGVIYYFTTEYPELISIVTMYELLIVYALVVILGIFITILATVSAVNRYLRMTTNKLYHI